MIRVIQNPRVPIQGLGDEGTCKRTSLLGTKRQFIIHGATFGPCSDVPAVPTSPWSISLPSSPKV